MNKFEKLYEQILSEAKIPKNIANEVRDAIKGFVDKNGGWDKVIKDYENGIFPRSEKVKDLNKRFRWDLFYGSKYDARKLYNDYNANDDHIDTILKNVIPKIEKKY